MENERVNPFVQEWIDKLPDPDPEVSKEDETVNHQQNCEEQAFVVTPENFKKALQQCKYQSGDPERTLVCITAHGKYFCFFCYDVLQYNMEVINAHTQLKSHFSNEKKKLVPCPFASSMDLGNCKTKEFSISQLRNHVIKKHLPLLDEFIKAEMAKEELTLDEKRTISSGYQSAVVQDQENVPLPPVLEPMSCGQGGRNNCPIPNGCEGIHEAPVKLPLTSGQMTCSRPKDFICPFCNSLFRLRFARNRHYLNKVCSGLEDKWCHHCRSSFTDFTMANCVQHLLDCKDQ